MKQHQRDQTTLTNSADTAKRYVIQPRVAAFRGYPGTWTVEEKHPTTGLTGFDPSSPKVAAKRGNPWLSYVTASRYETLCNVLQGFSFTLTNPRYLRISVH
ncbi:MAG TPA: hypothetical protein VJU86_07945 [Pyrinomonadaceae bacterium]|nr:hypothetical protein [Pyrinomonadaceae bacterium]